MTSLEILRKDYCRYILQYFRNSDVATFKKKCVEQCSHAKDRKIAIELALRDALLKLLCSNGTDDSKIRESYVTFCIELCRKELVAALVPVVILKDMFDAMTLDRCEELFTYVENNVSIWKEDLFFAPCKNSLLRMCNDLLTRLSRSQQTVFCGRILLFLAKFFPFSERSGLNVASELNLGNKTEFGPARSEQDVAQPMEVDGQKSETKVSVDYNLYSKFWTLQDFFRNPNQCYNKAQWKTFSSHTSDVLLAFTSFKLEDQKECMTYNSKFEGGTSKEPRYFAKYLTNEKLLELQLSDSNFRRCVLLQFLILFQYLNSTVKFKPVIVVEELKSEEIEWVNRATAQVYALLTETPPDGAAFVESVRCILQREEHWSNWKNDNCPAFKKPTPEPTTQEDEAQKPKKKRKLFGDIIKDAQAKGRYYLGNPELTKLWNLCPNNLEACTSKDRNFLPSLEDYFQEAIEQLDPAAGIEEQYKKCNDESFCWRALRILAKGSPHFFIPGNYMMIKLSEYIEIMVKKTAADVQQTQGDVKREAGDILPSRRIEPVEQKPDLSVAKSKTINKISHELVNELAEILQVVWEKLAIELGYRNDEILYFAKKPTPLERCREMLVIWTEEDPDASTENLRSILEKLCLTEAVKKLDAKISSS